MSVPEPSVMVTEYTVSCLPEYHADREVYEITVSYRGPGKWAVTRYKRCLDPAGKWDWESIPSEREDEWLATHRFDLESALALAREAAPKIRVNGFTVADVLRLSEGSAA